VAQAAALLQGPSCHHGVLLPLGKIINNRDVSGRIAKWSVELMGEALTYAPQKAIKSQVLVDFVAEWIDIQLPIPEIQS
jgi:hypothetical protein